MKIMGVLERIGWWIGGDGIAFGDFEPSYALRGVTRSARKTYAQAWGVGVSWRVAQEREIGWGGWLANESQWAS